MVLTTPTNFDKEGDWGKAVRDITDKNTGDMQVYVTGNLGFSADAKDVFSNIDTKLLLATVALVLVLLGAIYRSVMIAITPLIVVFFAYSIAQGLIYAYADSGATVSTNSTSILIVLMFGVGTDYCLLLVSRYREELRRIEDKHDAMARAVRRAGPCDSRQWSDGDPGDAGAGPGGQPWDELARAGRRDRGSLRVVPQASPCCPPC